MSFWKTSLVPLVLLFLGILLLTLFDLQPRSSSVSPRNQAISDCVDIALDAEIMGLAALPKTEKGITEAVRRCHADMAMLEQFARSK